MCFTINKRDLEMSVVTQLEQCNRMDIKDTNKQNMVNGLHLHSDYLLNRDKKKIKLRNKELWVIV